MHSFIWKCIHSYEIAFIYFQTHLYIFNALMLPWMHLFIANAFTYSFLELIHSFLNAFFSFVSRFYHLSTHHSLLNDFIWAFMLLNAHIAKCVSLSCNFTIDYKKCFQKCNHSFIHLILVSIHLQQPNALRLRSLKQPFGIESSLQGVFQTEVMLEATLMGLKGCNCWGY